MMDILGKITGIKYKLILKENLKVFNFKDFDINEAPPSCSVIDNNYTLAISKWVSPKRTRSYPFERVYNSLDFSKKITVIPVVKDEGALGDRDYLQWDTVSLMSLLDVFVIFAYYEKAKKVGKKIKNQQFSNEYVLSKIKEIEEYNSSALHWNLKELTSELPSILNKVKTCYENIEKETKVKLHNQSGIDNFIEKIGKDVSNFMDFSREKSKKAQSREFLTQQPKESLSTLSKAMVTITDYLGGQYYLTVDEIEITKTKLSLIEGKHSKKSSLPSKSDIKDGLLKMILYSNLSEVSANGKNIKSEAVLSLTSSNLKGRINSLSNKNEISNFFIENKFSKAGIQLVETIFEEARANKFTIQIQYSK